jgi:hypothetical protein
VDGQDARRRLRSGVRRATARVRKRPDFLVIGAQKAGTTSLHRYLRQTEGLWLPPAKELHYFDRHHARGPGWYRAHFPLAVADVVVGEATPFYLLDPRVPARAAALAPDLRLVAVLRDPVARAYSHFHHSRSVGREPLTDVREAVEREPDRTDAAWESFVGSAGPPPPELDWFTYLRRGRYAPQLARWWEQFEPEQLLVLTTEDLENDPGAAVGRVRGHLGLPPQWSTPVRFDRHYPGGHGGMDEGTARHLRAVLAEDVAELEELLGRRTGWGRRP